ncbi:MAG: hypothetical protein N4A46_07070 [Schleiferiaceae bacterium]|nr:hypothetical protein [Schleiferiaceae bacterium]
MSIHFKKLSFSLLYVVAIHSAFSQEKIEGEYRFYDSRKGGFFTEITITLGKHGTFVYKEHQEEVCYHEQFFAFGNYSIHHDTLTFELLKELVPVVDYAPTKSQDSLFISIQSLDQPLITPKVKFFNAKDSISQSTKYGFNICCLKNSSTEYFKLFGYHFPIKQDSNQISISNVSREVRYELEDQKYLVSKGKIIALEKRRMQNLKMKKAKFIKVIN